MGTKIKLDTEKEIVAPDKANAILDEIRGDTEHVKNHAKNKMCPKCKNKCKQYDYVIMIACPDFK